jgi:hypothetical protein
MKEVISIYYQWWGNAHIENRSWQGVYPNGDVMDYNTVESLKKSAEEEGYDWEVLRHHRNGKVSILEKSY